MELVTIRWQETWGDQLQGRLPEAYAAEEAAGLLPSLAANWFPAGFDLATDPNSDYACRAADTSSPARVVWFFVEPFGSAG